MAKSGWEKWKNKKKREAKSKVKKSHWGYFAVAVLCLAAGLAAGYFGARTLSADDTFELKGEKVTEFASAQTVEYSDEGIVYRFLGKDLSQEVKITTNMEKQADGKYTGTVDEETELYIIYEATEGRCKGMTLYRVFRMQEAEVN